MVWWETRPAGTFWTTTSLDVPDPADEEVRVDPVHGPQRALLFVVLLFPSLPVPSWSMCLGWIEGCRDHDLSTRSIKSLGGHSTREKVRPDGPPWDIRT